MNPAAAAAVAAARHQVIKGYNIYDLIIIILQYIIYTKRLLVIYIFQYLILMIQNKYI